ncbi:EamA family transporter [Clostridium sardiniense]|uniref:EamA family transporter n=1 Tax=Clostridium sardiniense TaxID=29369 RepID=UPI003D34D332
MWIIYAIMSAVFAAITSIFAKIGINGINSNLATAIRTIVVLILAWGIVFTTGTHKDIKNISNKSMLFLILSGLATGLSWLFYYKAIQMGQVTSVVAIDKLSIIITIVLAFFILNEQITVKSIFGGILIAAGTLIMVL